MKRSYDFSWYPTNDAKYGREPLVRHNMIMLSRPVGKTEVDTKAALGIFMQRFGSLKKNTIVAIKEFGENGQIGEDIVPSTEENAIIPTAR